MWSLLFYNQYGIIHGVCCSYEYEEHENGMWLSLVERCVRDAEVAGSNPVIPTRNILRMETFSAC